MARLWLVLLWIPLLFGQQDEEVRIKTSVRQVLVPVVVTDAKGHQVTGLKQADFVVSEDGLRQTITSFSSDTDNGATTASLRRTTRGTPTEAAPALIAGAPKERTYVICFDTLHSSFANFARIREAVEKLFQKDTSTGAKFALVSLGRQLRVIQTATSDRQALLARVNGKDFFHVVRGIDAGIMALEVDATQAVMEQYCRGCACGRGHGSSGSNADCYTKRLELRQRVNTQVEKTIQIEKAFFEGLNGLVTELAKVPGDRTLILISDGFSVTPGAEFMAVASAYLPEAAEFRFLPETKEGDLHRILTVATKSDVRIHSLDSRGVASPSFAARGIMDASGSAATSSIKNRGGSILSSLESNQNSVAFQNEAGPQQLAAMTGGVYYHNSNDYGADLRSAIVDGREYYVLSYVPTNSVEDGKYRKITVEVGGRTLVVRAKQGYWAEKP